MEITTQLEDLIPILTLSGRFDGAGAVDFDKAAQSVAAHAPFLVLDLTGVHYLSSIGLRSLVGLEKALKLLEGGLVLTGMTAPILEVLQVSRLDSLLRLAPTRMAALSVARAAHAAGPVVEHHLPGCHLRVRRLAGSGSAIEWWKAAPAGATGSQRLIRTRPEDLGFGFGTGSLGESQAASPTLPGQLISTPTFAGVLGSAAGDVSDFISGGAAGAVPVQVSRALGLAGSPAFIAEATGSQPFRLLELLDGLFPIAAGPGSMPPLLGFVMMGDFPENRGAVLVTGLAFEAGSELTRIDPDGHIAQWAESSRLPSGRRALGGGVTLIPGTAVSTGNDPAEAVRTRATLEALQAVVGLEAVGPLSRAVLWLYVPETVRGGAEKLLQVTREGEGEGKGEWREEWDTILRQLYGDCRSVHLTPLHGGYMSKTFRAVAYDGEGRRMLPTVVKIGAAALTAREELANREYVSRFILNNGTTLLGGARAGSWAGLRYNFLGVNGPESRLVWLREHYLSRPVPEVLGLFETLLSRVLKPWYGQPKWEQVSLYRDHTPLRLFPALIETAETVLGISADDPDFDCHELGLKLPNPFHFLKHEYPRRASQSRLWYTAICHGDLNLQNVLVDERDNLYVIDFSETAPRNAVSDFARLEPILKFEMTRLETDEDLRQLLEFEVGLTGVTRLSDPPPLEYRGNDPRVARAHAVITSLRRCADTVTLFEQDLIPYWLALLEWTYSVVCYSQLSLRHKRYAACSAALICRSIQQLESATGTA